MPWLAGTSLQGASGTTGTMHWWGPNTIGASQFHSISIPSSLTRVHAKGSFATGVRHCYMVGNFGQNAVLTDDYKLWPLGIQAPTMVPTVALSGTGVTGEMICYLAYYDWESDLWSPLSAPSATLSAANQSIVWSSLPTPPNSRVTHIGLWRSIDGGLPRLVMLREVGVSSVTEAVALGDMGEAWVDEFGLFPRGRYNVIWHERHVVAGDDDHPDTLYLSLIGDPEKYSRLSLKTRSGQPIVGLLEIGGTLLVLCPRAIEIVTGWTEDDLAIEIVQYGFGGLGHHAVAKFHNYAMVWSPVGPYLTDGTGWWPMFKDIKTKWADEFAIRRADYDLAWGFHDPRWNMVQLHVGPHTDAPSVGDDVFWAADYTPVVPEEGGGYAQPRWSYDVSDTFDFTAAANLAVPGGRRTDLFYGTTIGKIYQANPTSAQTSWSTMPGTTTIRTGAMLFGDHGGDLAQGKKFVGLDMFVQSEGRAWVLRLFGGDEHAFPAAVPQFDKTIAASFVNVNNGPSAPQDGDYQPKTVHPFNLSTNRVQGRALVLQVTVAATETFGFFRAFEFRGFQLYWLEGEAFRGMATHTS